MDERKQTEFSGRMVEVLNAGALNLALGLGYRLGLLDALGRLSAPVTAEELAQKTGLSARYIKEWLGVMVTGRVVDLGRDEAGQEIFRLPAEHAACLTKAAGNANLGVYMQEMPLLASLAWDRVAEGFKTGQGIGYHRYPSFHAFMDELSQAKHRQVLIPNFLPQVDGGRLVERLKKGQIVCDVGCGQGLVSLLMAEAFPHSSFVGLDISEEAISLAEDTARQKGLTNVEFIIADAARLAEDQSLTGRFDYVTAFDSIHDLSKPAAALAGIKSILKPGGLFSMIDIAAATPLEGNLANPLAPFCYAVSLMHCLPVGLADNGTGLGMMWGREKAEEMLTQAGFTQVEVLVMPDDPFNLHFQCRV